MSIGGGQTIAVVNSDVVGFQIVGTKEAPGVVWLFISGGDPFGLSYVSYEKLEGAGEFRMELHTGKVHPVKPASPEVRSLHTIFTSDAGEWTYAGGWSQGTGVHAPDSADELNPGVMADQYMTFLLYPTSKRPAGAGVRCKVDESSR